MAETHIIPFPQDGKGEGPLTMSSREIAELCEKRHDHVMRDIRVMLVDLYGEDRLPNFGGTVERPNPSGGAPITSPVFNLPKDLTLTLVAGYNVKLRHRIVVRWMELEKAQSPALPADTTEQITRMFGMMRQMSHRSAEMSREIAVLKDQSREIAALNEKINAVVEVVTPPAPGAYVPGKRLVTILEEAGITDRPRGLINFFAKELAKAGIHHTGKDYMKVRLYPQEAVSEWLRKSGDKTLHRYIAEKRGQNALCLFNPNPVRKRGKNTCNDGVLLSSLFAEACCAVHELVKSGQVSAPGTPQHEYFMRAAFAAIVMASGISFPRAYSTPPALPAR